MATIRDDLIVELGKRWNDKQELVKKLLVILKGNGPVEDNVEIVRRINEANELLRESGIQHPIPTKEIWLRERTDKVQKGFTLPSLDLRGFPFRAGENLAGIVLCGSHLEGSYLESVILESAHLEHAELERVKLFGCIISNSSFAKANLRGIEIHGGTKLINCNFYGSDLKGAHIIDSHLNSSDFSFAKIGSENLFVYEDPFADEESLKIIKQKRTTTFKDCFYLPYWRDHFIIKKYHVQLDPSNIKSKTIVKRIYNLQVNLKSLKAHFTNRWFYTNFNGVMIDEANTIMAPDLFRYIKDQQYLLRFRKKHPRIYRIWKLFSDCGGKLSVVAFWSILFVLLFSWLYPLTSSVNPHALGEMSNNLPPFWMWIYISFDIFSNLGIRNTQPLHPFGVILMIIESILGLMMLGMLLSVLQNRFARRS